MAGETNQSGHIRSVNAYRLCGVGLVVAAAALASYGIWLIATVDVQGGRHEVGGMFFAAAIVAVIFAAAFFRFGRRSV
jgi:hypothetical protein